MGQDQHEQLLRERRQAWWTSVLAGPIDQSYPVPGARITAALDGDTLVVSGTVATDTDRQDIQTDVARLVGQGISNVQLEVEVAGPGDEEPGLLIQTLVGIFESESQAQFAASYLESQRQIEPIILRVLPSESRDTAEDALGRLLARPYWEEIAAAREAKKTVLVLTVDETAAFQAREILDEETRSLQTIVLPPVPVSTVDKARALLADAASEQATGVDRDLVTGHPPS